MSENEIQTVKDLYCEILETDDLSKVSLEVFMNLLKPDTLFERFAARKACSAGASKEFLEIKGQKFQIENTPTDKVIQENELVGFKCLHYSVTESAGYVELTIVKKSTNSDLTIGVRTKDGTAKGGQEGYNEKGEVDYEPMD